MDPHRSGLALGGDAAAVQVVEADAPAFQGRGHRRDLEEIAGETGECSADRGLVREASVHGGNVALGIQGVRCGAEARGGCVGLVEAGDVAREAGCASYKEHEEARGERVEGARVPDLGLCREEALDPGDRSGARDALRLVEEEGAGWCPLSYLAPPRSR